VARTGFSATTSHKSRQARKGATVVTMSGAGGQAGAGRLLLVTSCARDLRASRTKPVRIAARSAG